MSELREVFEMTTKQVEPDLDAWREQEQRQRRSSRNKRLGALAVAAAIGLAAIVAIVSNRGGDDATTPADDPTVAPADATAEVVARRFLGAYGSFDAEKAIAYLAEDADITGLVTSVGAAGVEGTVEEFRLLIAYLDAGDFQQRSEPCEELSSSGSATELRCTFDFHFLGSDDFGWDPFNGGFFSLTLHDGEIVRASKHLETAGFSQQMWEPFADWVSTIYPEDAAVMYTDATYSGVQLTEESIGLWEQRTREYVNEIMGSHGPGQVDGPTIGRLSRIVDGVTFSFDVPADGWEQFGAISINKSIVGPQGAEAMIFWTSFPDGELADPCADVLSSSVGPTAGDLAAAVSTAPGTELVAGPSDVTVGGLPAKHVVLTVREDLGCDPGYFYTWPDVWWGALWPETGVSDTIRVWMVDVGETRLFIEAETTTQASPALEQEIQQIIDSIRFD